MYVASMLHYVNLWFTFVSFVLNLIQLQGKLNMYIITWHFLFVRFLSELDTTQQGLDQNSLSK